MKTELLIAYIAVALVAWPLIARFLYRYMTTRHPSVGWDSTDDRFCVGISFLSAAIWPVALTLIALGRTAPIIAKAFLRGER